MPGSCPGADVQYVTGSSDEVWREACLLLVPIIRFLAGVLSAASCLTAPGSLDGIQYLQYLSAIPGSGSPPLALRVLLYSKVLHIRGTATGYKVKAWVYAVLLQLRGVGVCLEVLHLCPDAKLWRAKAVPGLPVLGHSHATEIIL